MPSEAASASRRASNSRLSSTSDFSRCDSEPSATTSAGSAKCASGRVILSCFLAASFIVLSFAIARDGLAPSQSFSAKARVKERHDDGVLPREQTSLVASESTQVQVLPHDKSGPLR